MPAYYRAEAQEFLDESTTSIVGKLAAGIPREGFEDLRSSQISVWTPEIEDLKAALTDVRQLGTGIEPWGVLLEFPIPRRARRVDAIVVTPRCVFVIEFKSLQSDSEAIRQVEGYALDLADFHKPSRDLELIPLLVTQGRVPRTSPNLIGNVWSARAITPQQLGRTLQETYSASPFRNVVSGMAFDTGEYHPVPSIIDAAVTVFQDMTVREIADAACGAQNLSGTVEKLREIVQSAVQRRQKSICFVTGVPGSGKTLAGLTIAHDAEIRRAIGAEAAFFSGNGPLVKVLRAALVRDRVERIKRSELTPQTTIDVRKFVETKIQNIHMFARHYYDDEQKRAPFEHVIIFDEAQRAWNAERNRRKFKRNVSEPEMILSVLDRGDWCVLIALIGGGQEIHDGEAGLGEWGRALTEKYCHWQVYAPESVVRGSESTAFMTLFDSGTERPLHGVNELELGISTRTVSGRSVNAWCNSLLAGQFRECHHRRNDIAVFLTRDLEEARDWLRDKGRGLYRSGLVASSGASRLRAYGIETSTSFHRAYPYDHWFLDGADDIRSSYKLEVAATEFEIQGLELDFVGLCWGGDLVLNPEGTRWIPRTLRSNRWAELLKPGDQRYLMNSYRVLLTRARHAMVIWVPPGNPKDSTLRPDEYDAVAECLINAGAKPLGELTAMHA